MQEGRKQRYLLPARARIKQRLLFDQLFESGQSLKKYPLRVSFVVPAEVKEGQAPVVAGFSVPKRRFKRAVDRNLLKRRMREAWRLLSPEFVESCRAKEKNLAVLLVYQSSEILSYEEIANAVKELLRRMPLAACL